MDEILGSLIIIVSLPIAILFGYAFFIMIKEILIEFGETIVRTFGYILLKAGTLVYPLEVKKKVAKLERQVELRDLALDTAKVEIEKLKNNHFYDEYYRYEHDFRLCVLAMLMQHGKRHVDIKGSWYEYEISEPKLTSLSGLNIENIECSALKTSKSSTQRNFRISARVVEDNSFDKRLRDIDKEDKYLSLKDTGEKLIRYKKS